ncbi:hypothetical protein RHECNPAF_1260045 [Rhizobium etli CNPAF512]|nr:hypothetical protein RHECNPAF_1260045 [Rhizobium etli CNPAF512]
MAAGKASAIYVGIRQSDDALILRSVGPNWAACCAPLPPQERPQCSLCLLQQLEIALLEVGGRNEGRRRADIDRRDRFAAIVFNGDGDRAEADFQLLIDDGITLGADAAEFGDEVLRVGLGIGSVLLQFAAGKHGASLAFGKGGEQHPAHRGAIGRQAAAWGEIDRHDAALRGPGDIDDFGAVEHRGRGALAGAFREKIEMRLQQRRQRRRCEIGMAKPQNLRRQREELAVIIGIAELGERQQRTAHRGAVERRQLRGLGDRKPLPRLAEGFDDLQAAGEAADEIRFAHDFQSPINAFMMCDI